MSNIAEGFDRSSPKDFIRFLNIAKGSCAELRAQLYVALDVDYIDQQQFSVLVQRAKEVSRIIGGLIQSIKRKNP